MNFVTNSNWSHLGWYSTRNIKLICKECKDGRNLTVDWDSSSLLSNGWITRGGHSRTRDALPIFGGETWPQIKIQVVVQQGASFFLQTAISMAYELRKKSSNWLPVDLYMKTMSTCLMRFSAGPSTFSHCLRGSIYCFFQSTYPTHTHTQKEQGVINAKKWKINIIFTYSEVLSLDWGGHQQKSELTSKPNKSVNPSAHLLRRRNNKNKPY
jgi:hypothetical protein